MTRFLRFRFSLATLLIAMAWSGVVVWMNITPRVTVKEFRIEDDWEYLCAAHWGWPWEYARDFEGQPEFLPRLSRWGIKGYWALAGDVAVGALLAAVLTWVSSQLLCRVASELQGGSEAEVNIGGFPRFRFSLVTLSFALAWSAVVVWMNTGASISCVDRLDVDQLVDAEGKFGWPWHWASWFGRRTPVGLFIKSEFAVTSYWALAGDIAVGLLLVAVLTWGSNQLLRRVGAKSRRRSASQLSEQQALDSHAE